MGTTSDPATLIDLADRTVSPKIFADPEIYRAEQERIFGRCWLYVAHDSQVPNPGDFVTSFMGEEPVIVCRDLDGRVHVFLNSCRHRGMQVCRFEQGNARSFQCPYHGWTYDMTGRLVGVPDFRKAYYEELDRSKWGLLEVPRSAAYRGLIFASFEERAPSLEDYLGGFRWYLDMVLDRSASGMMTLPGVHKWTLATNWKFGAEQFSGDNYHTMWAHQSAVRVGLAEQFGGAEPWQRDFESATDEGHGWINLTFDDPPELNEVLGPYLARLREEAAKRLSPMQVRQIGCVHVGTVFPNFSLLSFLGFLSIRAWHPRGPDRVDVWSWSLVQRDAPQAVLELARDVQVRTFSPAGIFEQDDGEMWTACYQTLRGTYRRRFPLNYQMSANHGRTDPERPGLLHPPPTEIGIFGFYRRWRQAMADDGARG